MASAKKTTAKVSKKSVQKIPKIINKDSIDSTSSLQSPILGPQSGPLDFLKAWYVLPMVLVIFFLAPIISGIVIKFYGQLAVSNNVFVVKEWFHQSVLAQFFYIVLAELSMIVLVMVALKFIKKKAADIGLVRPKAQDFLYIFIGYFWYFLFFITLNILIPIFVPEINNGAKQNIGFETATSNSLPLVFAALAIFPPFAEEIMMRGFVYAGFKKSWGIMPAAIGVSILFAIAHLDLGSGKPLIWMAAVDTFGLSFILIWLREKTGGLTASIGLHVLKNTIAFFYLFVFVGR